MDNQRNERIKYIDPIERLYKFITALDTTQRETFGMNYSVRGNFISIYLPLNAFLEITNHLAQKNRIERDARDWAVEQGYSPLDTYFRLGPYTMRIAVAKEKLANSQDITYLQNKYLKEIQQLKQELTVANRLLSDTIDKWHETAQQLVLQKQPKKRKKS